MRKPAQWKVELVDDLSDRLSKSKVSAIVGIKGISNNQLQKIRRDLRGEMELKVTRGTLIWKALEKSGVKGFENLRELISGQVAILTTDSAPNATFEKLSKTKQKSPAKGGEVADDDIVVEASETSFPPGPMVSEFQKVGLQTAIEKGKIVIKKDTVLVKKGETISKEKAGVLKKLEIFPLTVGIDMKGALYDGIFFDESALSITPSSVLQDVSRALVIAKKLALASKFIVPEIVPELLVMARINAESLAIAAGVVDEGNIELFILKAIKDAAALGSVVSPGENVPEKAEGPKAKKDREPEKKENVDDQISEGLGALFG